MTPRRRAKIDDNQNDIVSALRQIGATVNITSSLGGGFPDIVVSFHGQWYIMEIKDGDKVPSKQRLTSDEKEWIGRQNAIVHVVNSVESAIDALTNKE